MDCDMPIMNGYEATQQLCVLMQSGKVQKAPIIALTAFSEGQCLSQCQNSGMSDYSKGGVGSKR
jgi:CheY-like chemotaxis protein